MIRAAEKMDEGIRAYTHGELDAARRCWMEVLAGDPGNARARAYLSLLESRVAEAKAQSLAPSLASGGGASPWDHGPAAAPAVVLGEGDGLDLASVSHGAFVPPLVPDARPGEPLPRQGRATDVEVWMQGARELFALGDFSGSLEMIEKILRLDPAHVEAREYLRQNEATLTAMYESKLGPLDARPRLAIRPEEIMWLNLDHRAGFLLAQIDGIATYDDLFALSGLPRLDTARILATLSQEGVIRA